MTSSRACSEAATSTAADDPAPRAARRLPVADVGQGLLEFCLRFFGEVDVVVGGGHSVVGGQVPCHHRMQRCPAIRAYSAAHRSACWEPSDPSTPTTTGAAVTSGSPTVMPVTQLRVTGPGNPRRAAGMVGERWVRPTPERVSELAGPAQIAAASLSAASAASRTAASGTDTVQAVHTAGCGDADVGRSVHVEMVVRGQEGAGEVTVADGVDERRGEPGRDGARAPPGRES